MTRPRDTADPFAGDFAELRREATPIDAHPDEETWVRFASGELAADERERLVDHALSCEECAAIARAVAHVREGAPAIDPGAALTTTPSHGRRDVWVAMAAALVIAIGGVLALRQGQPTRTETDGLVSATPSGQTPAPAPLEPREWARLDAAPEVRLPASLALAVRGADQERDELLQAFGEGIAPYREGRFREAAARLAPLAARRPDVPEFAFYLGVARLHAGDSSAAVVPLRAARASALVGDDARWHEAVALERATRRGEAEAVLSELCASSSPYQPRACAALKGLP